MVVWFSHLDEATNAWRLNDGERGLKLEQDFINLTILAAKTANCLVNSSQIF